MKSILPKAQASMLKGTTNDVALSLEFIAAEALEFELCAYCAVREWGPEAKRGDLDKRLCKKENKKKKKKKKKGKWLEIN
jgi:hypothetical protein